MSNPTNIDLRGEELNTIISEQGDNVVIVIGNNTIKMTRKQYIEFNKKNGEFIKHLPFEVPAIIDRGRF